MKNRLTELFKNKQKNIFSIFFTAGFPNLKNTSEILLALQDSGADLVEVGFPFSDPLSDGPAIQHSSEIALKNAMSLEVLFEQLSEIKNLIKIPIVLMGYVNPVIQFGYERFISACQQVGVDGLILPDLPLVEYKKFLQAPCEAANISFIPLITQQTSPERIVELDSLASGFLYLVSKPSVTGGTTDLLSADKSYFERIKKMPLKNPKLVGFGIHNRETFNLACEYAHGAIIGSAFVRALEKTSSEGIESCVKNFCRSII